MSNDPNKVKKKEFEDRFIAVLAPIFQKYILDFRQSILDGKRIPGTSIFTPDFAYSLDKHYRLVQNYFKDQVFAEGDPVASFREAREYFENKIELWRESSTQLIAPIVAETNVIQAERSLEDAERALNDTGSFSRFELAVTASVFLKRQFDARRPIISQTETQAAAESTKDIKAEAVENTSLKSSYIVLKTWNSLLDGRERETHGAASGQERNNNEPFTVGGSSLYYPGDINAPIKERINCRCFVTSRIIPLN